MLIVKQLFYLYLGHMTHVSLHKPNKTLPQVTEMVLPQVMEMVLPQVTEMVLPQVTEMVLLALATIVILRNLGILRDLVILQGLITLRNLGTLMGIMGIIMFLRTKFIYQNVISPPQTFLQKHCKTKVQYGLKTPLVIGHISVP